MYSSPLFHKDHSVSRLLCVVFANHSHFLIPVASEAILARQTSSFTRRCMHGHDEYIVHFVSMPVPNVVKEIQVTPGHVHILEEVR